jgi:hypothetical protein
VTHDELLMLTETVMEAAEQFFGIAAYVYKPKRPAR